MGVVFTSLFALGLVLIVWTADRVDLDPNCVLFGSIESIPLDTWTLAGLEIPRAVLILLLVTLLNLAFVVLFFKELKLAAFDSQFSDTMGYPAAWMHYALMMLVAVTAVACFESVGSVLVVAMLVVPPASALMLTHRLKTMIGYSSILAIIAAVSGHLSAIYLPRAFGYGSTSTSGMMAVMCGVLFVGCVLFGPQYGVVVRWSRQRSLARQILADDVLAWWYRQEENKTTGTSQPVRLSAGQWTKLASELGHSLTSIRRCTNRMLQQGLLQSQPDGHSLTDLGRERAKQLVRSHRLWEQYLIDHAQVDRQKIHDTAEKLEHFTDRPLRDKLFQETAAPETDPHGSPIPEEHPER